MSIPRDQLSFGKVFLLSCLAGTVCVLAFAAWSHFRSDEPKLAPPHHLAQGIDLSAQLSPASMGTMKALGYKTVIDLRPDGEASDEPSAAVMESASHTAGLAFHYVPVPHGDIPQASVDALRAALAQHHGPVIVYCRSGKRAARTWALAEAGRPDGLSTEQIISAVQAAGQDAHDLRFRIDELISSRSSSKGLQ